MVCEQDIPLLNKDEKGRRAVEQDLGNDGHCKGLRHMVIVQCLWWKLKQHTVAPEVKTYRLPPRAVEHVLERMMCKEAQLEARAEAVRDPVIGKVDMTLLRYNPHVTAMEVGPHPEWRVTQAEGTTEATKVGTDKRRERLRARRRKRIQQVSPRMEGATDGL